MTDTFSWTVGDILEATKGRLRQGSPDLSFKGISIDSRKVSEGNLFVAIKGKKYDAHDFIDEAIRNDASGVILNRDKACICLEQNRLKKNAVCIAVDNTTRALGDLAHFNRKRSGISVVAVTGSNGKTTTKEMAFRVISRKYNTLAAPGNYNNEIGLPLTLFNLERSHEWAVLELGMNSPGEIGRLAEISQPDIGIITNIGPAHLDGFDSIEGIMHAKGELLEKIKPDGTAVLNADDPRVMCLREKASTHVLLFGTGEKSAIRARSVKLRQGRINFILATPAGSIPIELNAYGSFFVYNALAAAAAGYLAGVSLNEIKCGLEEFVPLPGRMNIFRAETTGITIIDDTYNANPVSMEAAITAFKSLKGTMRGAFVVGDMLELGKVSDYMHRKTGSLAACSSVSRLYITGEFAGRVSEGALEESMNPDFIFIGTPHEILEDLKHWCRPGDWIMVKGSRGMRMEKIVHGMLKFYDE